MTDADVTEPDITAELESDSGAGYVVSEIFIKAAFLLSAWHRSTRYGLIEGGLQVCGQSGPHALQGDRLSK